MEEGSPQGATGYQADYGAILASLVMEGATGYQAEYSARLASLAMEFASMNMSDQEFFRALLPTAPGNVTPARYVSDIPVTSDVGFSPPVSGQNYNRRSRVGTSSARPVVPPI